MCFRVHYVVFINEYICTCSDRWKVNFHWILQTLDDFSRLKSPFLATAFVSLMLSPVFEFITGECVTLNWAIFSSFGILFNFFSLDCAFELGKSVDEWFSGLFSSHRCSLLIFAVEFCRRLLDICKVSDASGFKDKRDRSEFRLCFNAIFR